MKCALKWNGQDPQPLIEFVHHIANLHIDAHTTTDYFLLLDALRDKARFVLMHFDGPGRDPVPLIQDAPRGGPSP